MREHIITCDICGKLLQSTGRQMCDGMTTELQSVTVKIIWSDKDVSYDLCPKCKKRMERYLKKEARRSKDNETD